MAIFNPDGTPYQVTGSMQQFDPENPEHELFNIWDQGAIEIGGTPLFYYDVFLDINTIDRLYRESRSKLWSPTPICIFGYYEPVASQNFMNAMGIDSPDEIMFEFNYRHVIEKIGHAPKVGARIFSPHKQENWVVVQRNVEAFQLWGELRLQIMCMRFDESVTTGEGKVTQPRPDFDMSGIRDLKKEMKQNRQDGCS